MNQRANRLDLAIVRGTTLWREVEWTDEDRVKVPFGAGWSGAAQVRHKNGDLIIALGVTLEDPGIIQVRATPVQTAAIADTWQVGEWDLLLTDPATNVWPILFGEVEIFTAVTR